MSVTPIVFVGDSLGRIRGFPQRPRREIGFQLDRVQRGRDPRDWKPMKSVGEGVREIRVRDPSGAYRVIYFVEYRKAVYVLHAFIKKTQRTSAHDLRLATQRLKDLKR